MEWDEMYLAFTCVLANGSYNAWHLFRSRNGSLRIGPKQPGDGQ